MRKHILTAAHITAYAAQLRTEEHASATIEKYCRDTRAFLCWLRNEPVTKEAATRWKAYLLDSGLTPPTVNAKLSALNGLFKRLGWSDCAVRLLKCQKAAFRSERRQLTIAEYNRLLAAPVTLQKYWLALLMETICSTGIRVSELHFITVEAARTGRASIALKGKIRIILLPRKLCRKLLKYAEKQKIASGEIFLTKGGAPLDRNQIWRAMKSLSGQAGVEASKIFPHNLRHLFAVTYYEHTRDIAKLADLLGHSSINTTRIYLLTTGEEHLRQLDSLGLVS